mgnify:CR=1 FL=1
MTKSDYEAIAEIIRHILGGSNVYHAFVDTIVNYMKAENPLFNENKFREACRENPDKDGEARIKTIENKADTKDVEARLRKYQNDKSGMRAAMDRMNEKFKKLNKEIREEKSNLQ